MSNKTFSALKEISYITEKQPKYFSYEYRKVMNFGKLCFLPKIFKRLHNVPERPVILNCSKTNGKMLWVFLLSLEIFNAEGVVIH